MTRNLDHEIQQALSRIGQLEADLRAKKTLLRELEAMKAEQTFGLKIGSVVIFRGKRFQVCEVNGAGSPRFPPSVYAHPFRKDGSVGAARRYLSGGCFALAPEPAAEDAAE